MNKFLVLGPLVTAGIIVAILAANEKPRPYDQLLAEVLQHNDARGAASVMVCVQPHYETSSESILLTTTEFGQLNDSQIYKRLPGTNRFCRVFAVAPKEPLFVISIAAGNKDSVTAHILCGIGKTCTIPLKMSENGSFVGVISFGDSNVGVGVRPTTDNTSNQLLNTPTH